MGKISSKLCSILSYPIREYERKKTLKIYKEISQEDSDFLNKENTDMPIVGVI